MVIAKKKRKKNELQSFRDKATHNECINLEVLQFSTLVNSLVRKTSSNAAENIIIQS